MDIYCIPPVSQLDLIREGDRAFCLAQLYIKHKSYREYFQQLKKDGWWITLDNGVGDHDPISSDVLLEVAQDLQPSEVIPLDVLFNFLETIENKDSFIQKKKEKGLDHIEILACPQGQNLHEWMMCYENFLEDENVNTIGMSKLAIPWVLSQRMDDQSIMQDRHRMISLLKERSLLKKSLHFLGAGDPREFEYYVKSKISVVRSTDSCFSILAGANGLLWEKEQFQRIKTPKFYFDLQLIPEQIDGAKKNIEWLKERLH